MKSKNKVAISFEHSIQFMWCSKDVRLLWILGSYIYRNGVRRDIDVVITDMWLGKNYSKGRTHLSTVDAQRLRELTANLDDGIDAGLIHPRLEKIKKLINKLNF